MGLFSRNKAAEVVAEKALSSVDDRGWTRIFDWIPGAWQSDAPLEGEDSVLTYPPLFACVTLIKSDIGKLRPCVQRKQGDVWVETDVPASRVLKKPNTYQNHIQFKQW